MDRPPAPPPSQVYTSDVLLLLCALISLTFRACRQGVPPPTAPSSSSSFFFADGGDGAGEETSALSRPRSAPPAQQLVGVHVEDEEKPYLPAVHSLSEGVRDGAAADDGGDGGESAVLSVNAAADPLLILAERLTLEEKLSTGVNWLSLVSNCLTYFLRPSQVLYTFLFTNGDFVLFVTAYSNRYQRLHATTATTATRLDGDVSPENASLAPARRPCAHSPVTLRGGSPGADADAARAPHRHPMAGEQQAVPSSTEESAAVSVPPPLRSPFPSTIHVGTRHREAVAMHQQQHKTQRWTPDAVDERAARAVRPRRFHSCRSLLLLLRFYMRRCAAFAQTQLSWLLFLNALLTTALFVFHLHHLFFFLGTLFGYLAAVASLFLCGMELGCIVVRLRRRCGGGEEEGGGGDGGGGSGTQRADALDGGSKVSEWDMVSNINGPTWAFVGEHLSAAACSALYVWMLVEEGEALWSTHVDLMRWYVCSCALMTLSLLKCLRAIF